MIRNSSKLLNKNQSSQFSLEIPELAKAPFCFNSTGDTLNLKSKPQSELILCERISTSRVRSLSFISGTQQARNGLMESREVTSKD